MSNQQPPTFQPAPYPVAQPHAPGTPPTPPAPTVRRRRPRLALVLTGAAALVVGIGIGAASAGSDPTSSDEYQALAAQLETARGDASAAADQVTAAQDAADKATDDASRASDDAAAREKKLDAREAGLDKREKALDKREDAVSGKEKKAKASEIEDGTWTVGTDIAAGTYKIKDKITSMCYWAILRTGSNGEDIVANDLPTGGYPSVTLRKGQDFENQCGTWKKVG